MLTLKAVTLLLDENANEESYLNVTTAGVLQFIVSRAKARWESKNLTRFDTFPLAHFLTRGSLKFADSGNFSPKILQELTYTKNLLILLQYLGFAFFRKTEFSL